MRPLLLDTNAYTAFKRGDAEIVQLLKTVDTIGISPIVLGELLGGFRCGNKDQQNREELHAFLSSPRIAMYPITSDTAHFYSHIYAALRKKGCPIPSNDLWIAAQALENGCILCSYDQHFQTIEGLLITTRCDGL